MNININRDEPNINDFLIVFEQLGQRPNKLIIHDNFIGQEFIKTIDNASNPQEDVNLITELIPSIDEYVINQKVFRKIIDNIWCSYIEVNKQSEEFTVNDVCFFYKGKEERIILDKLTEKICKDCSISYEKIESTKINTLIASSGSLDLDPISDNTSYKDIKDHYNSDILDEAKDLISKIKKNNKGISIISGERGTGKTTLSKYISHNIDNISLFIPNNIIDQTINNPEFRIFLKRFEKCLIIIDDCEFINGVFNSKSYFATNVLQLVEGFASDLSVQILLVFNSTEEEIDDSLLECNSLIASIEIGNLDDKKIKTLSKKYGFKSKNLTKMKLIDVIKNRNNSSNKIGLK